MKYKPVRMVVCEVYPAFGTAFAARSDDGARLLINTSTEGIRVDSLAAGDFLDGMVNDRNFVFAASPALTASRSGESP